MRQGRCQKRWQCLKPSKLRQRCAVPLVGGELSNCLDSMVGRIGPRAKQAQQACESAQLIDLRAQMRLMGHRGEGASSRPLREMI